MEEGWFRCGHSRSHLSKLIFPFSIHLIKTIYFLLFVVVLVLDLFSVKILFLQAKILYQKDQLDSLLLSQYPQQ